MIDIEIRKHTCTKCGQEKSELDFYPNKSKPNGLATWCKECTKEAKREWYSLNRETQKRRVRKGSEEVKQGFDPTYGTHACNRCHKTEPEVVFNLRQFAGRFYKRHLCTTCFSEYRKEKLYPSITSDEGRRRQSLRNKIRRKSPELTANHILGDSRRNDKQKGRDNDLDLDFVRELIKGNICSYCGETNIRITLDRIDNNFGHLKTNVLSCCIRCNGIRSNMPFEAWKHIVPKIRSARRQGLFGAWAGRMIKYVKEDVYLPNENLWTGV